MRADDLFETITDQLIAAIEAGADDWRMPWHTLAEAGTPASVDGHRYRGVNALWLPMVAASEGWDSGLWATYRGWQRHNAQVRRGEKGTAVLLWKKLDPRAERQTPTTKTAPSPSADSSPARSPCSPPSKPTEPTSSSPHANEPTATAPNASTTPKRSSPPVGADVHTGGNVACYQPTTDTIRLPRIAQFDQAAHYYATAAHEHIHWTGHEQPPRPRPLRPIRIRRLRRRRTRRRTRRRHVERNRRHQRHHPTRPRLLPRALAPHPPQRRPSPRHRRQQSPTRRRLPDRQGRPTRSGRREGRGRRRLIETGPTGRDGSVGPARLTPCHAVRCRDPAYGRGAVTDRRDQPATSPALRARGDPEALTQRRHQTIAAPDL